jgi:hypothetical protein
LSPIRDFSDSFTAKFGCAPAQSAYLRRNHNTGRYY